MKRGLLVAALVASCELTAVAARADDTVNARAEYDAAAAAYDRRDYPTAARRFALADEHAPNPRALQLAMASALLAPEPALAMNLVERSDRRAASGGRDPATTELARKLRAKFEATLGRVEPTCPGTVRCEATVDGEHADAGRSLWVTAGTHDVRFVADGTDPVAQRVTVRAGQRLVVTPTAQAATVAAPAAAPLVKPEPAEAAAPSRSHVPFWVGVAATSVAVTVSGILTAVVIDRHDDFVARPSATTATAGSDAQDRARTAWIVSGVFAAGTVALGLGTYW